MILIGEHWLRGSTRLTRLSKVNPSEALERSQRSLCGTWLPFMTLKKRGLKTKRHTSPTNNSNRSSKAFMSLKWTSKSKLETMRWKSKIKSFKTWNQSNKTFTDMNSLSKEKKRISSRSYQKTIKRWLKLIQECKQFKLVPPKTGFWMI